MPVSELIIWQVEPTVASGMPLAVTKGMGTEIRTPVSGGPAAPGVKVTEAPMVTGGPGMVLLPSQFPSGAVAGKSGTPRTVWLASAVVSWTSMYRVAGETTVGGLGAPFWSEPGIDDA